MTYTQQLKKEVELYLKNLDEYEAAAPEALKILAHAAAAAEEKHKEEIAETENAIGETAAQKKRLQALQTELAEAAASVKSSVETYLRYERSVLAYRSEKKRAREREWRRKNFAENEAETQTQYAKLLAVRQKYADEFAAISMDPKEVEKKLGERAAELGKKLEKLKADKGYCRLLPALEDEERQAVERLLRVLPLVYIKSTVLQAEKYADLLRLYALYTGRKETADCAPAMSEGAAGVVCAELLWKILRQIANQDGPSCKGAAQSAYAEDTLQGFGMRKADDGGLTFEIPDPKFAWDREILLFKREELQRISDEIGRCPDADFPEMVSRLTASAEPNGAERGDFLKDFTEFTRLYRETPEERLVTEQRYFQQKLLEQAEEKNRLLQQQIDDEQERYYEEQREAARRYREEEREREQEEARRERERRRERAREEEREREREREARNRERRAADETRRKEAEAKQRELRDTRHQCNTCANAGHCSSFMQRPNCAAYRPR